MSLVDRYADDTHSAWATAQWGPQADFAVIRDRSLHDPPRSLYIAKDCHVQPVATDRHRRPPPMPKYSGLIWGEVEALFVTATQDKVIVRLGPATVASDITCTARTLYQKQLDNMSSFLQANTAAPRFLGAITSSMFDPLLNGARLPQIPKRIYISIPVRSPAHLLEVTAEVLPGSIMEFTAGMKRVDFDTPPSRMYELIASEDYVVATDLPRKADNVACAGCEHCT